MRPLAVLFSLFFVFLALAETTHDHEHTCDAPCPAVCLGSLSGSYCGSADSQPVAPAELSGPIVSCLEAVFVHQLSEDEIFHPPAV